MLFGIKDKRIPLPKDTVVELIFGDKVEEYTINTLISSSAYSMKYLAMTRDAKGYNNAVMLKELFPRSPEEAFCERGEDGEVLYTSPCGEAPSDSEYIALFEREATLTREAKLRDKMAVPEVLGPVRSKNGGLFLVTRLPFRSRYIGYFAPDEKRDSFGRLENLGELVEILKSTCDKLSEIHEKGILHLLLAHSTVYCARNDRVRPFDISILDFSNAVKTVTDGDGKETIEGDLGHIAANEYSAPEIQAVSSIEPSSRSGCGYTPDRSSDTYSLCSLFYKLVLGRGFSIEEYGSATLLERLRALYPKTAYPTLAKALWELFLKGLAPKKSDRFRDFTELKAALEGVSEAVCNATLLRGAQSGAVLPYLLYSEHPLFEAAEKNGDTNVLFVGSTDRILPYILSAMSVGQMAKGRLCLYAVSDNAEELREGLFAAAPAVMREDGRAVCRDNLSIEIFDKSYRGTSERAEEIADFVGVCRYAVINMSKECENGKTASLIGSALYSRLGKKPKMFVYTSKEAYRSDKGEIKPIAFGENLDKYGEAARELGLLSQKIDLFTVNTEDGTSGAGAFAKASASAREKDFVSDSDAILSALCSAVHIKYKLKSVGIGVRTGGTEAAIAYAEKLGDGKIRRGLIELEHRRRMLYAASLGFTAPTYSDFDTYAYRFEGKYFNRGLDSGSAMLHRCLVPCDTESPRLPEDISTLRIKTLEEIEGSDFDELDKMSLMSWLYLRERVRSREEKNRICAYFGDAISGVISHAKKDRAPMLCAMSDLFAAKLSSAMNSGDISEIDGELSYLSKVFSSEGQNISDIARRIKCELSVYSDCDSFVDLARIDRLIIDNLHHFCLCESITLVKPCGRMKIDNAAAALILRPDRMLLVGSEDATNYSRFFKGKGMDTVVSSYSPSGSNASELYSELKELCESTEGRIVFDITGSSPLHTAAVMMLVTENKDYSVIRCDEKTQRLENVCGFELSPLYRSTYEISARESYGLFGAKEKNENENEEEYLEELGDYIPDIWQIYLEHRDRWDKLVYLIALCDREEFHASNIPLGQNLEYSRYSRKMTRGVLDSTGVEPVLRLLSAKRAIQNLSIDRGFGGFAVVSYDAPNDRQFFTKRLEALFDRLYEQKLDYTVHEAPENKGIMTLTVSSGRYCRMDAAKLATVPYKEAMPILYSLERKGLVFITKDPGTGDNPGELECLCACPGLLKLLMKAGNVLEAYVWYAAKKTGAFDDVRANFKFSWTDPDICNELDVILTRGLSSTVISCKTTNKTENMHLYEVKYLTEHFTVNSRAVIVYAIDNQAQLENMQKRAAAMGIGVISLADLESTEKLMKRLLEVCDDGNS